MYVSDMQAYTVAAQSTRESKRENKRTFASFWVYYVMCGDGESVSQANRRPRRGKLRVQVQVIASRELKAFGHVFTSRRVL